MGEGHVNIHDPHHFTLVVIRGGTNEPEVEPDPEAQGGSAPKPALKPLDFSDNPMNGHGPL